MSQFYDVTDKKLRTKIYNELTRQSKVLPKYELNKEYISDVIEIIGYNYEMKYKNNSSKYELQNIRNFIRSWINDILTEYDGLEYFIRTKQ